MPSVSVVTIEAHTLALRTGLWCDVCQLPSRVEADIALVWPSSLRVFGRFTKTLCIEADH